MDVFSNQQWEQTASAIRDTVSMEVKYFEECKKQGYSQEEALASARSYIRAMLHMGNNDNQ